MAKTATKAPSSRIVVPLWQAVLLAVICLGIGGAIGYTSRKAPAPESAMPPDHASMMGANTPAETGMTDKDRQAMQKEIEGSKDYGHLVELGNQLPDEGEAQLAVLAYEKALTIKGTDPNVWTDLGAVYTDQLGENQKAIDAFNKAISLDSKHAKARFNLGIATIRETGDVDKMNAILKEYMKIAPPGEQMPMAKTLVESPGPTLREMAKGDRDRQHLTEAENELRAAMKLGPADPEDWYLLGTIYIHQSKYREALAAWAKYEKLAPNGASMAKVKEMRPNIERMLKGGGKGMQMPPGGMSMPPSGMGGG